MGLSYHCTTSIIAHTVVASSASSLKTMSTEIGVCERFLSSCYTWLLHACDYPLLEWVISVLVRKSRYVHAGKRPCMVLDEVSREVIPSSTPTDSYRLPRTDDIESHALISKSFPTHRWTERCPVTPSRVYKSHVKERV